MNRQKYNREMIDRCLELLQSSNSQAICEGVVLAAYLVEQSFKWYLRDKNPLLYFDVRQMEPKERVQVVLKTMTKDQLMKTKTAAAIDCLQMMGEMDSSIAKEYENIKELLDFRNFVQHSIDDFPKDPNAAAETAVSSLKICRDYIAVCANIKPSQINPLTSDDFKKLQEDMREERINNLFATIQKHKELFEKLKSDEVGERTAQMPEQDSESWIEETTDCPACEQCTFDHLAYVDFDWSPDGVLSSSGSHWCCRVCELELSPHEFELWLENPSSSEKSA